MFDVNVKGLLLATKAAVALFPAEGGSVINIGSVVSEQTPPGSAIYSGTKGAVDAITRVFAKELGPKKIRVNAVNPGMTSTEGVEAAGFAGSDSRRWLLIRPRWAVSASRTISPTWSHFSPRRTRAGSPDHYFK